MLYNLHELKHVLTTPIRIQAKLTRFVFQNPLNPWSGTQLGRRISANSTMIIRATRKFNRPEFGIDKTSIGGKEVDVTERIIAEKPFCSLLNFKRKTNRNDPKILLIAPMSGHYSTLLRGTVEALIPHHDVYITDWENAKDVPINEGKFDLTDYITYLRDFMTLLGSETHVIAICQPAVPALAAVSLMATQNDPNQPLTMTLMGGPIDTRVSKTEVTQLAETRPLQWFKDKVLYDVPAQYDGANRQVYPGFLQLSGFMSMNLDTHISSHMDFYNHLITGDNDSIEKHRKFYNEYLSVMDIPAEFYLQTIEEVFQKQLLPRGKMKWRDPLSNKLIDIRPQDIKRTALLTIEGELDDISARGQTTAAHDLCYNLAQKKQYHHFQRKCGHYGIFNGSKYRNEIMPRIRNFIRKFDENKSPIPAIDLLKTPDLTASRFNYDRHGIVAVRRWIKENQPQNYKNTKITRSKEKDTPPPKKELIPPVTKPKMVVTADLIEPAKKKTKTAQAKPKTKPKTKNVAKKVTKTKSPVKKKSPAKKTTKAKTTVTKKKKSPVKA